MLEVRALSLANWPTTVSWRHVTSAEERQPQPTSLDRALATTSAHITSCPTTTTPCSFASPSDLLFDSSHLSTSPTQCDTRPLDYPLITNLPTLLAPTPSTVASHCAFHKHLSHQARHSSSKHPDDFQCHLTFKHPYRFASHSPSNGASTSRMKVSSTSTRQPQHLSHFYPLAILASQCELQCLLVPYRNASKPLHRAGFTMTQLSW